MATPEEIAADAAKVKEAEEAAKTKEAADAAERARLEQEAQALADANAKKSKEELQIEIVERDKKIKELARESKERRIKLEQFEAEEKKRIEANLSETEREKKRADELAAENAKIKSDLIRREVIEEVGLPGSFASRLQGATKEELLADAKELAKTLPQLKVAPKVPPTNPSNSQAVETEAQKRERLFGKQGNVFDMESIKAKGGGVIINK